MPSWSSAVSSKVLARRRSSRRRWRWSPSASPSTSAPARSRSGSPSPGAARGVGPLIGGGLVQAFGWQAIFWINLPLGLAAIWLVLRTTPESFNTREGARLDVPGAVVLTLALVLLSYGLVQCDTATATALLLCFGGALALFALFVLVESRAGEPLVPLSVFRRPAFMGAVSANLLANVAQRASAAQTVVSSAARSTRQIEARTLWVNC